MQYREQTIAIGSTMNDDMLFAYSVVSPSPGPALSQPQRPTTSRETSWATLLHRKPVPALPSAPLASAPAPIPAPATLRGKRSGGSDERAGREKERSRTCFIRLPFSDDKKRSIGSRKRPPSVAATAPIPSYPPFITSHDSTRGATRSLRGAFGDTTNLNGQIAPYPPAPITFDEKMCAGRDWSAGGTMGDVGSRRARSGSTGLGGLYRARTYEERGVKKKRGFFCLVEEGLGR